MLQLNRLDKPTQFLSKTLKVNKKHWYFDDPIKILGRKVFSIRTATGSTGIFFYAWRNRGRNCGVNSTGVGTNAAAAAAAGWRWCWRL